MVSPLGILGVISSSIVLCCKGPGKNGQDACSYMAGLVMGAISSALFYASMIFMIYWMVVVEAGEWHGSWLAGGIIIILFKFVTATLFAIFAHKCRMAHRAATAIRNAAPEGGQVITGTVVGPEKV